MAIQEPFVKINTLDFSELASRVPDALNTGLAINSDTGPVGITRIDSQAELISKYFTTMQLNPTDDVTVKHAYKLLQFTPIYVTRAFDNSIFGGITNNGDKIFVDTDFKVMKYYTELTFTEDQPSFNSVYMKLKVTGTKDHTATMFYCGGQPKYTALVEGVNAENKLTLVLPEVDDIIYDTVSGAYYRVKSVTKTLMTLDKLEALEDGNEVSYFYAFGVNFKNKCTTPKYEDLFALGSIVYDGTNYYTILSIDNQSTSELDLYIATLQNVIALGADKINILNLLTAYNSSSAETGLSKFYSTTDEDGKLSVTISNKTTLVEIGYRLNKDDEYTKLDIDSVLESSKYIQFSGNATSSVGASEYLSVNGFTFFNNPASSSNDLYPYINVNFNRDTAMNVMEFLTYIYDYQCGNDCNINPASLETDFSITLPPGYTFSAFGDFANKFIITDNVNESGATPVTTQTIRLLTNAKASVGYITIESDDYKYVWYTGYDKCPVTGYTQLLGDFDDDGMFTIHSSGKALLVAYYDLLPLMSEISLIFTESDARILYPVNLFESYDNEVTALVGPSTAESNYKYSFDDDETIIGNVTYGPIQLRIDDYLFYNCNYSTKNPDLTPVKISSAKLTYMQFIKTLRRIVGNYFKSTTTSTGFVLYSDDIEEFQNIEYKGKGIKMGEIIRTNNAGIVDSAKFAVINKCPSKKKLLQFSLTQNADDPELWSLVVTRKTDETQYTISFVEDKLDGYNRNVYYPYVNQNSEYIHLVELDGEDPELSGTYTSKLFGDEVPIAEPEVDDYIAAINRFNENEGIYYDFIFDAGYANLAYAKAIFEVCKNIYAEGLLTMPQITDYKQLIDYRQTCGIDTFEGWRTVMRGNWINDTTVADFLIRMSPMCAYLEKIVNNKNHMCEFAPVFGATNGSITYAAGFYINKKSIREELLNNQIPMIIEDKSLNMRYWNLDTTLKVVDSSLADANNCRMINCSAHICDNQMKWYIGRFNTAELRKEVTNALTNLISDRLVKNQVYPLYNFLVVCNETNNPVSVIENRELVVDILFQFMPGIRYIKVYQKVYKLSADLEAMAATVGQ